MVGPEAAGEIQLLTLVLLAAKSGQIFLYKKFYRRDVSGPKAQLLL